MKLNTSHLNNVRGQIIRGGRVTNQDIRDIVTELERQADELESRANQYTNTGRGKDYLLMCRGIDRAVRSIRAKYPEVFA